MRYRRVLVVVFYKSFVEEHYEKSYEWIIVEEKYMHYNYVIL